MDANTAYTAGYSAGLKGLLKNTSFSDDNSLQTSYDSGYDAGKAIYQPAFTAGYKDATKGSSQNTFYSATKAIQTAYNAGYSAVLQTNKIGVAAAYEWVFRGSITSGAITSFAFDSDNNIIIAGNNFGGTTLFNRDGTTFKSLGSPANWAMFLAKYSPNGVGIWAIVLDSPGNEEFPRKVIVDSNDNIYFSTDFVGSLPVRNADGTTFQTITNSGIDFIIIKYNALGFAQYVLRSSSSSGNETPHTIDVDSQNNLYIAVTCTGATTFTNSDGTTAFSFTPPTSGDSVLVKYNSLGYYQWRASVNSTGSDTIYSLKVDKKDNVYILGQYSGTLSIYNQDNTTYGTLSSNAGTDTFIVKYNSVGTAQWTARVSGAGTEIGLTAQIDSFDNLYIHGYQDGTTTFFSASGTAFGTTITAIGSTDHFLAKYNESGTVQWVNRIGGSGVEATANNIGNVIFGGNALYSDRYNNIYVANTFASTTLNIYSASNLSSTVATLSNTASRNGYLIKYDSSGIYQYAFKTGNSSTNSTFNSAVSIDTNNNLYITTVNSGGTATLFDSSQIQSASLTASNNFYLVKYNQRNTALKTAYDAGYSAVSLNTSYSATPDVQAAYAAGFQVASSLSTDYYYMGFNAAFQNKTLDPTVSSNATLQASYTAGFTAGQAAYKAAYTAGYADAAEGAVQNTSYSAADISASEIAPKQAAYNLGYYARQNSTQFHTFSFDWYSKMGNTSISETGRNVTMDSQNNIYFSGTYQSAANVVNNSSTTLASFAASTATGAYIIKQSPTGLLLSAFRLVTGTNMDIYYVGVDSQDFIYLVGAIGANIDIYNNTTGDYTGTIRHNSIGGTFVAKLTQAGVPVWSNRILGGVVAGQKVAIASDNSIYITFHYYTSATIYNTSLSSEKILTTIGGATDWGIVKFNSDGSLAWTAKVGSDANYEFSNAISVDLEGNIYVAGDTGPTGGNVVYYNNNNVATNIYNHSGSNFEDGLLIKISKAGEYIWYARWNTGPQDYFYNVVADNAGDVIVSGASDGGSRITIKYTSTGTQLWSKTGDSNYFVHPEVDRENNIYAYVGTALRKHDPSGNVIASFTHGLTSTSAILIGNNNDVYMVGSITASGNVTGNDSSGNSAYTASSGSSTLSDAILVKYRQRSSEQATAYEVGAAAYEAGSPQDTSYSALPERQASYDAGYGAALASHYNIGYNDGVKAFPQNTTYSTSATKQARYDAGYTAGSALFSAAFNQGYKDGATNRGERIYSTNKYLQGAYEQGYESALSASQTQLVKSDWFNRTSSTGADSADAIARDSRNNIYYGGYIGSANATVFNKFSASFGTLAATTQTAFIVKQNNNGAVLWASRFTSSSTVARVTSIVCDKYDNVYTYGIFNGTLTLYNNAGTAYPKTLVTTSTTNAAFLIKQSLSGTILWVTEIEPSGSTGVVNAAGIAYDATTNTVCVNGSYSTTTALIYNANGSLQATLEIPQYVSSSYLIKYTSDGFAQWNSLTKALRVSSGPSNVPTTSGLVAYFDPANTTSYPGSGTTLTSLVGTVTASLLGSSTYSDGTIRVNNASGAQNCALQVNNSVSIRTISMWIYIHSTVTAGGYLLDARQGISNGWLYFGNDADGISPTFWNGATLYKNGGSALTTNNANLNVTGSWQHITLVATSTGTDDITLFNRFSITEGINVSFGPITIYNRAITQAENLANYNATASQFTTANTLATRSVAIDSLGDIYHIADTSGTAVVYDASGTNSGSVTSVGSTDIIVAKYSPTGLYKWHTRIASTGSDIAYSSAIDTSNNLIIVGRYGATLTFYDASGAAYGTQLSTIGGADGFLAKYNAAGSVQLVVRLGGSGTDYGVSVATDKDNNQYLLATAATNVSLYNSNTYLTIPTPIDSLGTTAQETLKAVYATRKVRSAYTGPLFKIRRASDNVELDFYSDMYGVYTQNADGTGDTLSAWLNGATAYISTWYDQSKYGNHATQTTASAQPIFDLTNKYIDFKTSRYLSMPNGTVPGNNSRYTITCKHNTVPLQGGNGWSPLMSSGNFTSNQGIFLTLVNVANAGVLYYRDDWRSNSTEFTGYAAGNTFTATYDQSNARSYLNGTLAQTVAKSGQSNPSTNSYIGYIPAVSGTPAYMNGEIYFLSIFESTLSDTDRLTVENNIIQGSTTPTESSLAATVPNASSYSILAKYNAAGGLLWNTIVSANASTQGSEYLTIDDNSNIYLVGNATATAILDSAGATTYTLANAGSTDAVLIQYRQNNVAFSTAYAAGSAAFLAGQALNTSYSADVKTQAAYAAGYNVQYEYYYYAGYGLAFQNKALDASYSSVAIYQSTYAAGHAAGKTAYKTSFAAGYKDAALNRPRNTSYSAGSALVEVGPKQAGYDDGYYTQKNGTTGAQLTYEWYYAIGNKGISEAQEYGRTIAVDGNNNIWSVGVYTAAINIRNKNEPNSVVYSIPAPAAQSAFMIKKTPDGAISKVYTLTTSTAMDIPRICTTSDNKIYIVGSYQATINIFDITDNVYVDRIEYLGAATSHDSFVTKFGPESGIEWTCRLKNVSNQQPREACVDKEDNLIFSFIYGANGATIFDKNDTSMFGFGSNSTNGDSGFVKISKDGIPQWGGFINAIGGDNIYAITVGTDGSVYMCASNSGGSLTMVNTTPSQSSIVVSGGNDSFIFSVDKNGIYKWRKNAFNGGTIVADNSNNIIVRSSTNLIKYNAAGTQQWSLGSLSIDPRVVDKDNNIYGSSGSTIVKVSPSGTLLYTLTYGMSEFTNMAIDNMDSVYMIGNNVGGLTGYDSYGQVAWTTYNHGGLRDVFIFKYKQRSNPLYPTYYSAGYSSFTSSTYTASYSADSEIQAIYDAGYSAAGDIFSTYFDVGVADAAAGSAQNMSYSADSAIQTLYNNGYVAYTTAYNDGFTAGSSGSPANNTYTANATLSARYTAGYTAGVESVAVVVVTGAQKSSATYQVGRAVALESKASTITSVTGLDASGNYSPSVGFPYIGADATPKDAAASLADQLRIIETTYTLRTYVDDRISTIVNGAPAALDKLNELAASINNDPAFYSTILISTINEQNRAIAAEEALSTLNSTEASSAVSRRAIIQADLSSEIVRAVAAEQSISTSLATQTDLRVAQISSVQQTLQSQIDYEIAKDGLLDSQLNAQVSQRQTDVAALNTGDLTQIYSTIAGIELKTDNETSTSVAFLSTISSNLYSEIGRATSSISTIDGITVEHISTSVSNDSSIRLTLSTNFQLISSAIVDEETRAVAVEEGLSTILGTESERAIGSVSTLTAEIGVEISRAGQAEQDISGAVHELISSEAARALAATDGLSTALGLEVARAQVAENTLTGALNLQTTTASAAEQDISGTVRSLLTTENGRALLAEQALSTSLAAEVSRAEAAEANLTSSIVGESNRATASMSTISAAVLSLTTTEQGRSEAAEQALSTSLASEVSRATGAETALTSSLTSETARASVSMSTISAAVLALTATEQGRATLSEQGLSTGIATETARSLSTISSFTSTLGAEISRAQTVELDLSNSLQTLIGNDEKNRAEAAEQAISTAITAETTRATGSETALTSTINGVQAIISTFSVAVDTEQTGGAKGFSGTYIQGLSTIKSAVEALDAQLYSTTSTYASLEYIDQRVSTLINGASSMLNTFNEINDALNNDPAFASTLISTLAAETDRAIAAEADISNNLATEVSRATQAETDLTSTLTAEVARAGQAEQDISAAIYSAISTASGLALIAEADISSNIASEVSRATGAETVLTSTLNVEISRASLAEQDISGALRTLLAAEISRAELAEQGLSTSIAAELSRATASETALTTSTTAETSRSIVSIQDISGALRTLIADEETRSISTIGSISTALGTETTRALGVEQGLSTALSSETGRSISALADISGALRSLITAEESRAVAAEQTVSTAIVDETGRAQAAETTLSGNVAVEISRAQTAEQDISGATRLLLSNEIVRATGVETDISGRVEAEIGRATTAEQDLTSTIAGTYIVAAGYGGQTSISTVGTVSTGVWAASTLDISQGGTGFTSYSKGDLIVGSASAGLDKLAVGTETYALKASDAATPEWTIQDSSSVVLTSAANFTGATNLQQALNLLYANTKTRKVINHVVTSSTDYSDAVVPNSNYVLGRVHFINYDASNTIIYLPPVHQNVTYADGTVYRLVHNGDPDTDGNLIVRYRAGTINGAGTTITGTTYTVLEMAPRDSICVVWDQDTTSYKYAVGV